MTMLTDPRAMRVAALACAVALVLPAALGWVTPEALLLPALTALVAWVLSRLVPGESPRAFFMIWLISATVRGLALVAALLAQRSMGSVILGGDGRQFLTRALQLGSSGLTLEYSPIYLYGTYDVGPYYLFAAVVGWLGPDLVVLQMANVAMSSLTAPLTYAWAQRLTPNRALLIGLLLAVYPTSVVFSVVDLLKDPSVLLATTAAFCGVVYLAEDAPSLTAGRRVALMAVVLGGLLYLHVSRFYTLLFLGLAVLGAAAIVLFWRRRWFWRPVAATVVVWVIAECALMPFGWPPTPALLFISARNVMGATAGQAELDRAGATGDGRPKGADAGASRHPGIVAKEEALPQLARALRVAGGGTRRDNSGGIDSKIITDGVAPGVEPGAAPDGRTPTALSVDTVAYRALPSQEGLKGRAVDIVRKTLGPFVWIVPPGYDARTLLAGDYLLYPGMLFWYAGWPFMLAGLAWASLSLLRGRAGVMLGALALFCGAYLVLYLSVNLSFRQRDALLPFLLVLAAVGFDVVGQWRRWPWVYGAYWGGLVALAAAHLLARTRLLA